jgi:TfoX/Sxy family transcriptional regulator of competence genes
MATDAHFLDHIIELAGLGARLSYKKMFGEYALYLDSKVVAFACDNSLFVKPSQAAAAIAPGLPQGAPYPGAKDHLIADALLDEPERLRQLLLDTGLALPAPKPKKPGKSKADA